MGELLDQVLAGILLVPVLVDYHFFIIAVLPLFSDLLYSLQFFL